MDKAAGAEPPAKEQGLSPRKDPPCGVTLTLIEQYEKPVIEKGSPGTDGNKYGFEGGCVLKLEGVYHLFTSEMVDDQLYMKMRLAHWTSPDGLTWTRRDTMYESSGELTGNDPRAALWAPIPVFNEEEGRWNVFYVAYRAPVGPDSSHGRLWRAASKTKGRGGIGGPWEDIGIILEPGPESQPWEGVGGTVSIFAYPVGRRWMGFYGSSDQQTYWKIGLISAPRLAGPWKRVPDLNPVTLSRDQGTENPIVTRLKSGRYVAVFDTILNSPGKHYMADGNLIGYADSIDGLHWSIANQLKLDCEKLWAKDVRTPLGLVEEPNGTCTVFYTALAKQERYWNVGMLRVRLSEIEKP